MHDAMHRNTCNRIGLISLRKLMQMHSEELTESLLSPYFAKGSNPPCYNVTVL
jgi:hypothetical protein